MKTPHLLDAELFPPFNGFPKEGIRFLRRLKKNNNREWFAKHKIEFQEFLQLPMRSLIASLQLPMKKIYPEIDISPRHNMFRIYRDTRFSKDKSPYKTHVAAVFHPKGKWEHTAGFYVHIEPGSIYAGGGIYMPNGDQLKKIRRSVSERAEEFLSIVQTRKFKSIFSGLSGQKLMRAPLGYSPDHVMIEWLKHKSFYAGVTWDEQRCYSPRFPEMIVRIYTYLLPLVRFLNEALENPPGHRTND